MTTVKLPKYITIQSIYGPGLVKASPTGDLAVDGRDDKDPACIFETVEKAGHFQTYYFKSAKTGKFWKRNVNSRNHAWIVANAPDTFNSAADSFSFQQQPTDETRVLSFYSAPDGMFFRDYTDDGKTHGICAITKPADVGADQYTRFRVKEASAPH